MGTALINILAIGVRQETDEFWLDEFNVMPSKQSQFQDINSTSVLKEPSLANGNVVDVELKDNCSTRIKVNLPELRRLNAEKEQQQKKVMDV